ncbi:hypothetical protein LCGC14_1347820 [marine sediment metagenome]|uniref:Uncharacterized protein n=1 Tax=marine sediment metagenome TaxID=412755 RepID=A0A0F9KCE2_9ZZZZ
MSYFYKIRKIGTWVHLVRWCKPRKRFQNIEEIT